MSSLPCKRELQSFLQQQFKDCKVVVLPDFFLDRLINLELSPQEFSNLVVEVTKRKGGALDGILQTNLRGGNAINVASALASLGANVTPIVCTSEFGLQQIKFSFQNIPIDISYIKTQGKASITTALEFSEKNQKTNVMLRDLGSLADFGPSDLSESDFMLIENSDYICVFNWAGTLKFGTDLAQTVFGKAKQNSKVKTYFDTADPTPNSKAIPDLINKILKTDKVDILSLNENEAITYASFLDEEIKEKRTLLSFSELAMEAGRVLAQRLPARIDLHTTEFSATFKGKQEVVVPTFKVKILRATGAGDAWCAGNIIGDHNNLADECRLLLANAVAACYLSEPNGLHPTKQKLLSFLKTSI